MTINLKITNIFKMEKVKNNDVTYLLHVITLVSNTLNTINVDISFTERISNYIMISIIYKYIRNKFYNSIIYINI